MKGLLIFIKVYVINKFEKSVKIHSEITGMDFQFSAESSATFHIFFDLCWRDCGEKRAQRR